MGHATAAGFAEAVAEGDIDLEAALRYHLSANHYPPVPAAMVPVAVAAIEAINAGDYEDHVDMPEGVLFRGHAYGPAYAIAGALHLDAFLDED